MAVLKSDGFFDLAGLEAFYADVDPFGRAVYDGANALQVRHEAPYIDAGNL